MLPQLPLLPLFPVFRLFSLFLQLHLLVLLPMLLVLPVLLLLLLLHLLQLLVCYCCYAGNRKALTIPVHVLPYTILVRRYFHVLGRSILHVEQLILTLLHTCDTIELFLSSILIMSFVHVFMIAKRTCDHHACT